MGHSHTLPRNVSWIRVKHDINVRNWWIIQESKLKIFTYITHTLQAVTLATLSCQQPPLSFRHSLVSISVLKQVNKKPALIKLINYQLSVKVWVALLLPSLRQTFGSVVSSKPAQIALRTAFRSSFPALVFFFQLESSRGYKLSIGCILAFTSILPVVHDKRRQYSNISSWTFPNLLQYSSLN